MKNEIKIFEHEQLGSIRMLDTGETPWFVGIDVCNALGYVDSTNALKLHVEADDKLGWQITTSGQKRKVTLVNESGLYALIFGSKMDKARAFKYWVTSEVLPSIRKTGKYEVKKPKSMSASNVKAQIAFIEGASRLLNLNDSSKAMMLNKVADKLDAPRIEYVESKDVLRPISYLLKKHGINESAQSFNKKLLSAGLLERKTRKAKGGVYKAFYNITEKGLAYGENLVNPQCPRETQPMWHENQFTNLLTLVA